jgi:hypothetical protein
MTTATQDFSPSITAEKAQKAPLTLAAVIAALFMVNLRDSQSDESSSYAAYLN